MAKERDITNGFSRNISILKNSIRNEIIEISLKIIFNDSSGILENQTLDKIIRIAQQLKIFKSKSIADRVISLQNSL